jgi:hypothetical protein
MEKIRLWRNERGLLEVDRKRKLLMAYHTIRLYTSIASQGEAAQHWDQALGYGNQASLKTANAGAGFQMS